ncbi:hypothetical protein [Acidovorax radicis]|uniref:hypothetical protein n=1 Tax=Acidovorax radicis TaxID=758826 RepID=UPI001CFC4332|nr:hypothetical protein [Acidovorax radicis]UCV01142.1 hypothetical protein KI609_10715 [Acidovorax radicis]
MATLAGYAYFSRAENYSYIPSGNVYGAPWDAPLRAYAIYDDGAVTFLGAGTYSASQADSTGQRFGYYPANEITDANPDIAALYAITPGDIRFVQPLDGTVRAFDVRIIDGDGLLYPGSFDLSALAPGAVVSGTNYIAVAVWQAPELSDPRVIVAVAVAADPSYWSGITTISDSDRFSVAISAFTSPEPPTTPAFWTSLSGTKEIP